MPLYFMTESKKLTIGPNYLFKIPAYLLCWAILYILFDLLFLDSKLSEANAFETIVIWFCFFAVAIATPLMTYQLITKNENLKLDSEGFTDNTTFASYRVKWSEVESLEPWKSEKPGSGHIILVNLRDPDSFYERSNYKAIGGLFTQHQTEKTPYVINVMGLSKNRQQVIELMSSFLRR